MIKIKTVISNSLEYVKSILSVKEILILLIFLLLFTCVRANHSSPDFYFQQKSIQGVIFNEKGLPMPGVNVIERGMTNGGVVTDLDGKFVITVSGADSVLIVSVDKYKQQEVLAIDGMQIVMASEASDLDEVVLTGYQTFKANEFTGASSKIKMDNLKIGGVGTVDKMLQGAAAGVQVTLTSSVFGTAPKIRIRGSSSITGINEPLWVLDGVVLQQPVNIEPSALYSGNARTLLSSVLGGINQDDIEDITILKDASATALYGTKAVNGVIVITTKRASKNQPLTISYNSLFTLNTKPSIDNFNVLNSWEETNIHEQLYKIYQAQLLNYSAANGGAYTQLLDQRNRKGITEDQFYDGLQKIKSVNTDWFDVLFKNSITQQHSISASYGGSDAVGRLSLSYFNDPGFSIGQNVSRYTLNSSTKYTFSRKFSIEGLIKYSNIDQQNPGTRVNPYNYASITSRAMSPYDENGQLKYYRKNYVPFNIINEINNDYINVETQNIILQAQLSYKPIHNLQFTLLANKTIAISKLTESTTENSAEANSYRTTNFQIISLNDRLYKDPAKSSDALAETILPFGGFLNYTSAKTETNTIRFQGTYDILQTDNHRLNVFLGTEIISLTSKENYTTGYGYIFGSGTAIPKDLALTKLIRDGGSYYSTSLFNRNQLSFYANVNYTLYDKYTVSLSSRNDATNISGTSTRKRFLPTYVLSGSWMLSNEGFMKSISSVISMLKLRGSFGLRGNSGNRGPDLAAYYENRSRIYSGYNEVAINISQPEISDLDWEKEYITNLGMDLSLSDKVNITVEAYRRNNFDLVGPRETPLSGGYDVKSINWAYMRNEGLELSIENTPIKIVSSLTWKGTFNIGFNKNIILSNYIGDNPSVYGASGIQGYPFQGKPLTGLYSYNFAGLDAQGLGQYFDSQGNKVYGFVNGEKDYAILSYQGSRDPIYSGGFSSSFEYKGFALSCTFTYAGGNVTRKTSFYRNDAYSSLYRDDTNVPGDFNERWRIYGDENSTNVPRLLDDKDQDFYVNSGLSSNQLINYNQSNVRTINASFVRLRNISLRYSLAKKFTDYLKLKYMSLEIQGTNLAVFASQRLRGQDPESLVQGTNIPPVRSFTLGINVGF